jgi:hypothetical protein
MPVSICAYQVFRPSYRLHSHTQGSPESPCPPSALGTNSLGSGAVSSGGVKIFCREVAVTLYSKCSMIIECDRVFDSLCGVYVRKGEKMHTALFQSDEGTSHGSMNEWGGSRTDGWPQECLPRSEQQTAQLVPRDDKSFVMRKDLALILRQFSLMERI